MTPEERQLLLAMARMMRSRVTAVEQRELDRLIEAVKSVAMKSAADHVRDLFKIPPTSTPPTGGEL
jgi:hypothetical protein